MKIQASVIATAIALLMVAVPSASIAETMGYTQVTVLPNSDVVLCVPYTEDEEAEYEVASTAGDMITPTVALTSGEFTDGTYYIRVIDGAGEGLWSTITANDGTKFTVESDDVVSFLSAGDIIRVYKHQTIDSTFPSGMLGTSYVDGTEVLIFENDISTPAQNKPSVTTVTFFDGFGWFDGLNDGNTVLAPETQFVLRNNSGSDLTLYVLGDVSTDFAPGVILPDSGDLQIGSGLPIQVKLSELGVDGDAREVLFFDNTAAGTNKTSITTVTFFDGFGWFDGILDGDTPVNPSEAIVLRLPAGSAGLKITFKNPLK